jgi:hypothetical protein
MVRRAGFEILSRRSVSKRGFRDVRGVSEMSAPVIVGFDGSEHGSDALALGRALAETIGTYLLVAIADTPERLRWAPGTARLLDDGERELIVARAEDALSGLDGAQVRTVDSPSAAAAAVLDDRRRLR